MMASEELRNMSMDELLSNLDDAREELMNFRFQQSTGELTDHTRIRFTKRQIARLLTIIHEKELMLQSESES
jgi:large subunit ribosomal protein L29